MWTLLWNLLCDSLAWIFWGIRMARGVTWNILYCLWNIFCDSLGWLFWGAQRVLWILLRSFWNISSTSLFWGIRKAQGFMRTLLYFLWYLVRQSFAYLNSRRRNSRPRPLASDLQAPGTFYRAVTRQEVAHIANYPKGKPPKDYFHVPGDFSYNGALYVFADRNMAVEWGESHASTALDWQTKDWCLVEFTYTPNETLRTLTFPTGTEEWKEFIDHNYMSEGTTHYDIVRGPIQAAGKVPHVVDGIIVYQVAFIGPQALSTLVVEEVTNYYYARTGRFLECRIM